MRKFGTIKELLAIDPKTIKSVKVLTPEESAKRDREHSRARAPRLIPKGWRWDDDKEKLVRIQ